ncbi:MAG: DUF3429 domain-containing protein [Pseudomonadota bacterium]
MTDPTQSLMPGVPQAARWLGLAGVIPFASFALAAWMVPGPLTLAVLGGYGAVILSFMGGCRWGLAAAGMGEGPAFLPLALSVLPALYAWIALLLPWPWAGVALALGFALLLVADLALAREGGAPPWWPALRWPLSVAAGGSLLLGALA